MEDGDKTAQLKRLIGGFVAELDTSTMPYINTGLRERVVLPMTPDGSIELPRSITLREEAIQLKRSGQYLASAEKIIESFRLDGHYDLVNIRNLWKTALCGGDARGAIDLIQKAVSTYDRYESARQYEQIPHPPQYDLADVLEALKTEQSCKARLQAFSGNFGYELPRPYSEIMADVQGQGSTAKPSPPAQRSSGGCFVATAVYGSYEAPEVLVLRQFRDERLQKNALGRAFIVVYYAISPTLAQRLSKSPRMSSWTRSWLDSIVRRLPRNPHNFAP